ncbi:MAG: GtrA family protein [Sphingosinicella sp.]|nr:GtrA family protein [Sphingosinicella sp.]
MNSRAGVPKAGPEPAAVPSRPRGLVDRLLSLRAAAMLGRNTIVSCGAFVVGLALLWVLVERLGLAKVPATSLSFMAATTLHYLFGRTWIFRGSERGVATGYVYFMINAGVGLVVTTILFWALIELTPINYLVARILVSVVAGLAMFLLNAILNFRRL